MLTKIYVIYYLLSRISYIFVFLSWFLGVVFVIALITYLVGRGIQSDNNKKYPIVGQAKTVWKKVCIPWLVLVCISILMPDKKDILIFFTLHTTDKVIKKSASILDKYNSKNPKSNLNVLSMLSLIDNTIKKVDGYLDKKEIKK